MRRWTMAALVASTLGCAAVAPVVGASTAQAGSGILRDAASLHTVQYYGERRYGGGWERRQHRQAHRRARDDARIAAAARREAYRIREERAQRRAWRHGGRPERYGYYRSY